MLRYALIAVALIATAAPAAELREFDRATFDAAQKAGRPTVVDVHAWWCPVCAQQNHTIKATTAADHRFDHLLVLRLDYDKQKAEWQRFGVSKQATLIAFKGGHEVGRVAYRTNKDEINGLLGAAVG